MRQVFLEKLSHPREGRGRSLVVSDLGTFRRPTGPTPLRGDVREKDSKNCWFQEALGKLNFTSPVNAGLCRLA
jgi:hypothetical protein